MRTLDQLRERAEEIRRRFEEGRARLFRSDGQQVYGDDEHAERLAALRRERDEDLDAIIAEIHELVVESEQEIAAFERGDATSWLSEQELAAAGGRREFAGDDVRRVPEDELEDLLRTVLDGGDRVSQFVYWRAALGRFEDLGRPQELLLLLHELRDGVAGPERVARVERARATIRDAAGVELFVSNLKSGSRGSSADRWLNRRVGAS